MLIDVYCLFVCGGCSCGCLYFVVEFVVVDGGDFFDWIWCEWYFCWIGLVFGRDYWEYDFVRVFYGVGL